MKTKFGVLIITTFLISGLFASVLSQYIHEGVVGKYSIKSNKYPIEIPFEYEGMNILLKAKMNGINVKLLVDNGVLWDEVWFYGNNQVDSLNIHIQDSIDIYGAGEGNTIESVFANCPPIEFDEISFLDQPAILSPPEQGFYKMFPGITGQICGSLFRNFITEFDFESNTIKLHESFASIPIKEYSKIKMTKDESAAYSIPVIIRTEEGEIHRDIFIDLGGIFGISLVINTQFTNCFTGDRKLLAYGASGPIYGYEGSIAELQIGGKKVLNVDAIFTEDETGGDHTNLTIGLPVLREFNIIFDYNENSLYLK